MERVGYFRNVAQMVERFFVRINRLDHSGLRTPLGGIVEMEKQRRGCGFEARRSDCEDL